VKDPASGLRDALHLHDRQLTMPTVKPDHEREGAEPLRTRLRPRPSTRRLGRPSRSRLDAGTRVRWLPAADSQALVRPVLVEPLCPSGLTSGF
jgi:hypothetical protein